MSNQQETIIRRSNSRIPSTNSLSRSSSLRRASVASGSHGSLHTASEGLSRRLSLNGLTETSTVLLEQNQHLQQRLQSLEEQRDSMLHELQNYQTKMGQTDLIQQTSDNIRKSVDEDAMFYEKSMNALKSELKKSVQSSKEAGMTSNSLFLLFNI